MFELTTPEMIRGIRLQEKKLQEKWQKLLDSKGSDHKETKRYDAFASAYGLFGDCLEAPYKTKLNHVASFIQTVKEYLKPGDLNELRALYTKLDDDFEVLIGRVLGAKKISEEEV